MSRIIGWLSVSPTPDQVVCRSRAYILKEHFVEEINKSARCQGESCLLCAEDKPKTSFCVAVSRVGSNKVWLLRVPPAAAAEMFDIYEKGEQLIGSILIVNTISVDKGEGYCFEFAGNTPTTRVICENYVRAIGQKVYILATSQLRLSSTG